MVQIGIIFCEPASCHEHRVPAYHFLNSEVNQATELPPPHQFVLTVPQKSLASPLVGLQSTEEKPFTSICLSPLEQKNKQ